MIKCIYKRKIGFYNEIKARVMITKGFMRVRIIPRKIIVPMVVDELSVTREIRLQTSREIPPSSYIYQREPRQNSNSSLPTVQN